MRDLLSRNLLILFGCQVLFVTGTVVLVTIGGIVGYELAPDPSIATLPVALMVVGTALATIPAALLMQKIGRRLGFLVGVTVAGSGAVVATQALALSSYILFCVSTYLIGSSLAFSQQFRFAAAESVAPDRVSYAISFILIGSIIGAVLSPELVSISAAHDPESPYTLAFTIMIGLYIVGAILILGFRGNPISEADQKAAPARPFGEVARQPLFVTAVLGGVVGQGVMTYVMTATPISMNIGDGFSIQETSEVVRAHVIAMYLPSLFTPFLISRFGLQRIMLLGVVTLAITLSVGLAGHHYLHYTASMVLLGVGWNFLFVSGTTMLTQSYRPSERYRSQATNDFCVFGGSALASLMAGTVMHTLGWEGMLLSAVPFLVVMLGAVFWLRRSERLRSADFVGGRVGPEA